MPHPDVCPMCDQAQETIQHLLIACIFARQFWHKVLVVFGLGHLTPAADEESFADWWGKVSLRVIKTRKKGLNSLIILGAWCLWLQRNRAVFHGESPSLPRIFRCFSDECVSWAIAGTKELESLGLLQLWARSGQVTVPICNSLRVYVGSLGDLLSNISFL
jgi:hypothetical protein